MQKGLVSIIIVTRNSAATLQACLLSIQNQSYTNHEIIVVDNGSTDKTLAFVNPQKAEIFANPCNLGFAKANNKALAIARGEFILFLNSDATIEPNYLEVLISFLERDSSLGAVSGKIVRQPTANKRTIDSTGLLMEHWRLLPRDRGEGEIDRGQYSKAAYVFGVPGACSLYRRAALDAVAIGQEVMDEDFFAYYEDVDLAWRIRQQKWKALYIPEAIAYHCKKGPRSKEPFIQIKAFTNRYWCYIKNEKVLNFLTYAFIAVPYEILRVIKTLILNPSWIQAYFKEWQLLSKMQKKRFIIRSLAGRSA